MDQRDALWDRFVKFYQTEFDQFQSLIMEVPGVRETFDYLNKIKVKLVIASNPMWPMEIQNKRLGWAGLEHVSFDFITGIENMAYCKPRLEYYQAICKEIQVDAASCLMVGNDPVNDMIAARIGIKTYLTTDAEANGLASLEMSLELRDAVKVDVPEPDFRGPVRSVVDAVGTLCK